LKFETLPHPPYTPKCHPQIIIFLKNWIISCLENYSGTKEVENRLSRQELIASRTLETDQTGISKRVSLWEKCIQSKGDYFH